MGHVQKERGKRGEGRGARSERAKGIALNLRVTDQVFPVAMESMGKKGVFTAPNNSVLLAVAGVMKWPAL